MKPLQCNIISASCTGQSHLKKGLPGQDRFKYKQGNDAVFLVVADGAGSAPSGAMGAELAVNATLDALQEVLKKETIQANDLVSVLEQTNQAIAKQASLEQQSINDYACTLLAVAITTDKIYALQVGDGAIVGLPSDQKIPLLLTLPTHGEYINQTCFITSDIYREHMQILIQPISLDAIALFTDGLESVAIESATNDVFPPFFQSLFTWAKSCDDPKVANDELLSYLKSERLGRYSGDDKTLVCATCLA